MSNTKTIEENFLSFYNFYAIKQYWTKEEAVALSLNIDPRDIKIISGRLKNNQGDYFKSEFCAKYNELIELVTEGVSYNIISSNVYPEHIARNIHFGFWPQVEPLSFLSWCKLKNLNFPPKLEVFVRNYHKSECIDWEAKYKEIESQKKKLAKESDKLKRKSSELEEDKVNTKNLNFYKQFAMGLLALQYGSEQVEIWQKWANRTTSDIDTKGMDLKFSKIQEDLESLNAKGINIKRAAISAKINESIHLLKHKS